MTSLSQIIQKLLHQHNYVVIPGFGAFVANYKSARINNASGTIHPPKKQLFFNTKLVDDDGILSNELAVNNTLPLAEARSILDHNVSKWKETLDGGGEVILKNIGKFHVSTKRNVIFTQFPVFNFLLPSYGLEIAKLQPVNGEVGNGNYGLTRKRPETIVIEKLPVSYKRFRAISVALIVLLTGTALYLYMLSFHPKKVDEAGLNPFGFPIVAPQERAEDSIRLQTLKEINEGVKKLNLQVQETKELDNEPVEENKISTGEEESIVNDSTDESAEENTTLTSTEENNQEELNNSDNEIETVEKTTQPSEYHVIVSSLKSKETATKSLKQFIIKGFDPKVIEDANGKFRISLGGFATRDSAETFKNNISNDNNIDGWILTK